ncbi:MULTISPECIES: TonB-dependent receptor [Pseudomonas]|nr:MULTISPECIES: TonB-dependent siderophore receptor [Pseudomonas]MAB99727.1 TonB-dependent siderophore receptor [Pseudomonadaceae bacterium]HCP56784.1 TonB-dependent siderophore receptor [Pseudomonas sp.]MBQ53295.1 TonB-dependent siderophore receptor [Pseudomonadaceae bacterium]NRH27264.1 TonB-dependent siderophore receptor [Pseudomonas sp. MS19]OEO27107.1 ligand-gated channel protein [Pseudomonas sp. J237]
MRGGVEGNLFKTRLLVSAVGAATAMSAGWAQAEEQKTSDEVLSLGSDTVTGQQQGEYKAESASSKYTAPLRETPKSVTVISDQVIKDTGSLSLADALRTTSGITFGAGEGGNPAGDRPIIRGFNAESDTFIDGLRDVGSQTREIFNVEQIEVSKGPGSAYTGAGSTGGSLNLISKSAKMDDFGDASFTYGSDQTHRYTLDVNRKLADNIAGRLNLLKHEANVAGRDGVDVSRWGVAPTITFGFDTPTRLTLSYYHLETDDMPDYGIPLTEASASNPIRTPVNTDEDNFYGIDSRDYRESTSDAGTIKLEHDLNDNLTLSNNFRAARTTLDYVVSNPDDSRGNVDDGFVYRSAKSRNSTNESWINQTDLKALFNTGSIEHTLVTGIEISRQGVHNRPYVVTSAVSGSTCNAALIANGDCTSLSNPNPDSGWTGTITDSQAYTDTDTDTLAGYVFDTLKFNEQWSLNLGLRYDDYETTSSGYSTGGRTTPAGDFKYENKSHFWSYQTGLVFNPTENGSIYVAWSTSSNPAGETAGEGADSLSAAVESLEPERNRNYEIGTKWDLFDNRLGLNAAIFRTEKTNARVADVDGTTRNIGETKVDGFELGATGQITRDWQVFASYTYLDGELVDGGAVSGVEGVYDGNDIPSTPENSFSFWTTYNITQDLSVGAGANYVDSRFGNTANTIEVPDYWRYDAMAKYRVSESLDLQLNVQNLTDERYYDQVYASHYAHVAAGRTALLSTNFHF